MKSLNLKSFLKNIFGAFSVNCRKSPNINKLVELENIISYKFKDFKYLEEALRHRSYTNSEGLDHIASNERLEFLGDAVLEIIISDYLFRTYEDKNEGLLTKIRSHWVSKKVIFEIAKEMNLGDFIYLSNAEAKMGGRDRKTILSDAYESLLGAVYLDGGIAEASELVKRTMLDKINELSVFSEFENYKSDLLEFIQANKLGELEYRLVDTTGPDHRKNFVITVFINNVEYGTGSGFSKKIAEQEAAKESILMLKI